MKINKKLSEWWGVAVLVLFLSFGLINAQNSFAQSYQNEVQQYSSIFQRAYDFIIKNYVDEVDPKVLYEGAMKGMFDAIGDPHSTFLSESMMSDLSDTTLGKFGGLGINITKPVADPLHPEKRLYVEVVSPIEDTPGWKAGLLPGDMITHIEGESVEPISMDDVLKKLRGTPGTKVTITIQRGSKLVFDETLTRAIIEVPTVKREMLPNNIAYLRIIEFTPQTTARVQESLEWFKTKNYSSLIIDLRNNPGGLLSSVIQIADFFLDEGVIVSTKSRTKYDDAIYKARPSVIIPKDMPVVVMINKGSASASEILAGALKDHKKAYLVGENSYGKGSVQQVLPIGNTGFKLTMARYYTPSDVNIDKIGIAPDLAVIEPELTDAETESLLALLEESAFEKFAQQNPNASKSQVNRFVSELKAKGSPVSERILRKMVRNQLERTSLSPVYDLDYDIQLNAAIDVIQAPNFKKLLSDSSSLKEMQSIEMANKN